MLVTLVMQMLVLHISCTSFADACYYFGNLLLFTALGRVGQVAANPNPDPQVATNVNPDAQVAGSPNLDVQLAGSRSYLSLKKPQLSIAFSISHCIFGVALGVPSSTLSLRKIQLNGDLMSDIVVACSF